MTRHLSQLRVAVVIIPHLSASWFTHPFLVSWSNHVVIVHH